MAYEVLTSVYTRKSYVNVCKHKHLNIRVTAINFKFCLNEM